MKKFILVVLFLFVKVVIFAQGETNIWYFGNKAGLDFNSGSPVALLDSQMNTREGCATISNSAGQLLFYTDGITVWNKNHIEMPNGKLYLAGIFVQRSFNDLRARDFVQEVSRLTYKYINDRQISKN